MGVFYGGLSLENILMDEEGHIRLSDFEMSEKLEPGQLIKSDVRLIEYLGIKNCVFIIIIGISSRGIKRGGVWILY